MSIPPISPSSLPPVDPPRNPVAAELFTLWNNWWLDNTGNPQPAAQLISFLAIHESDLLDLSRKFPCPVPTKPTMEFLINASIENLARWISHGCKPNEKDAPSELINDIYCWIDH